MGKVCEKVRRGARERQTVSHTGEAQVGERHGR